MISIQKGSQTAKDGFRNEKDIVNKFNNWRNDDISKNWLETMGYKLSEIECVEAVIISSYKTDVQVQVTIKLKKTIDIQNLQVKLVSNIKGFNQIDKRWVDKYSEIWDIPEEVVLILKKYTGEIKPDAKNTRDIRRTFMNEFSKENQNLLLNWLNNNKLLILNDILKGRGRFAAEWMC